MNDRCVSVLQMLPGQIYEVENRLSTKLHKFSEFSQGTVLAEHRKDGCYKFGNYNVKLVGVRYKSKIIGVGRFFLQACKEAYRLRKSSGLDIIICYDPLKTGVIGLLLKVIFKCKLIIEVNGVYNSPELYKFRGRRSLIKKLIYPYVQQFVIRRVDALKCLFPGQLKGFVVPNKIKQYIFFDFTDIKVKEYVPSDKCTILTLGFPAYIKGIDLLILAFNALQKDFPYWKLKIHGHFSKAELITLSQLVGLNKNIEIKKPVNFSNIPEVIDDCDIFVLASRTEAMGRVLLETMARSKPRIGARVDGIPTVINDNVDGLLFEPNNAEDLQDKLRVLIESESERQRLAEAGYKRFNREFSVEKYSSHVKKLYTELIEIK